MCQQIDVEGGDHNINSTALIELTRLIDSQE